MKKKLSVLIVAAGFALTSGINYLINFTGFLLVRAKFNLTKRWAQCLKDYADFSQCEIYPNVEKQIVGL